MKKRQASTADDELDVKEERSLCRWGLDSELCCWANEKQKGRRVRKGLSWVVWRAVNGGTHQASGAVVNT